MGVGQEVAPTEGLQHARNCAKSPLTLATILGGKRLSPVNETQES